MNTGSTEDYRGRETILYNTKVNVSHYTLVKPKERTPPRGNPKVNYAFGMIMCVSGGSSIVTSMSSSSGCS